MSERFKWLLQEWRWVKRAPFHAGLFIVLVLICSFAAFEWIYSKQINGLEAQTEAARDQNGALAAHNELLLTRLGLLQGDAFDGAGEQSSDEAEAEAPPATTEYREPRIAAPRGIRRFANSKFVNQRILLDGYEYIDCEFVGVTFVYNGTSPIRLSGNVLRGRTVLTTDDPAVQNTVHFLRGLGVLNEERIIVPERPGDKITPMKFIDEAG